MVPCNGFTFSMVYFPVDGIRKGSPPSAWYSKGLLVEYRILTPPFASFQPLVSPSA